MCQIKRLYVTGYRQYELGIFQPKDPRITIIKKVLAARLQTYLDQGLEWVMLSGNQGTEQWAGEEVIFLKENYSEIKVASIFPYADFGKRWNEKNQLALADLSAQADYVNCTSQAIYQSPAQLRAHTSFMLNHTDGCLLLYDEEKMGKTGFFLKDARIYAEQHPYSIELISFDDLQNAAEVF